MTLQNGSNSPPISLSDINNEFNLGRNLGAYTNQRWYKDDNSRGLFATSNLSLSDFYSKRVNSPVVSGSTTITSSQNFTIPMFNNLSVTAVAGQGGQGGINGNCQNGTSGTSGTGSSLADYVSVAGGAGGTPSGNAGAQPSASTSVNITDENQASVLARYGTVKYATVGTGGGGGSTGYNSRNVFQCTSYVYYYGVPVCNGGVTFTVCDSATGGGSGGANGYVSISWT